MRPMPEMKEVVWMTVKGMYGGNVFPTSILMNFEKTKKRLGFTFQPDPQHMHSVEDIEAYCSMMGYQEAGDHPRYGCIKRAYLVKSLPHSEGDKNQCFDIFGLEVADGTWQCKSLKFGLKKNGFRSFREFRAITPVTRELILGSFVKGFNERMQSQTKEKTSGK